MSANSRENNVLATKNKRLAVILGLAALTIYAGYILAYYL